MGLIDLWSESSPELQEKQIHQLIAFAGGGKLLDGSACCAEFRLFLAQVPSSKLKDYADQCLATSFADSGLALQDVVNEVGVRLGATVTPGRYRGVAQQPGHDGLWVFPSGHSIVVEVKTTDAYRIDLNKIAAYRKALVGSAAVQEQASSILLIVGRQDTGDLEAQIRGSRYAWEIRIISVDALLRLMSTKEELEDPSIIQRIHSILIPREFTRLDEIAEVLFSTTEDVKQDAGSEVEEHDIDRIKSKEPKFVPSNFHDECIARVEQNLGQSLIKRSRAKFSSPDGSLAVTCSVSREHDPDTHPNYWYAFHPHQKEFLSAAPTSYVVLGCGDSHRVLSIPFHEFEKWLDGMWTTESGERHYWHIVVHRHGESYELLRKRGECNIDVTGYRLADEIQ